MRNILGHLPKAQHEQARSTLRAAWKLEADEGIRKVKQYAAWLEREWPSAAASLREGLAELFTVNRIGLPLALRRCLTTTNIIDSSHAGVRQHTRRVSRWRNGEMAVRWAATTFCETEKNFRRVTGYQHLWMLKAHLDDVNRCRLPSSSTRWSFTRGARTRIVPAPQVTVRDCARPLRTTSRRRSASRESACASM